MIISLIVTVIYLVYLVITNGLIFVTVKITGNGVILYNRRLSIDYFILLLFDDFVEKHCILATLEKGGFGCMRFVHDFENMTDTTLIAWSLRFEFIRCIFKGRARTLIV